MIDFLGSMLDKCGSLIVWGVPLGLLFGLWLGLWHGKNARSVEYKIAEKYGHTAGGAGYCLYDIIVGSIILILFGGIGAAIIYGLTLLD